MRLLWRKRSASVVPVPVQDGLPEVVASVPQPAPPADPVAVEKPPPFIDRPTLDLVELLRRRREHGFTEEAPPLSYIPPWHTRGGTAIEFAHGSRGGQQRPSPVARRARRTTDLGAPERRTA